MKKQLFTVAASVGILFSAYTMQASAHEINYQVQSGDTLWKIANSNNVSVAELQSWNNLNSNTIHVGQQLSLIAPHTHNATYTVKSGDTLYSIARNYNTTVAELKSMNQLTSDNLHIGQVLNVPNAPVTEKVEQPTTAKTYVVKSGDSLWGIATKNGLTVDQLKAFNGLTSNVINVGQVLKLTNESSPAPVVEKSLNVDALIAEGKKYIGVPYVWGGSTPKGFDCSGFLNYTFGKVGVSIPRTVETIWSATTAVSSPQKGDLVFYTTYKAGPSHAGIYIGDNKFLHAGSSSGVTITDMNNPYWKARYLGAKKVNL
ncbi:C40 family peptidase [Lysinibacillus antri]|uniref:Peptidoglycan endopeptidase n=1 Tax=Lysinibacillus antri TaxID=2498145 RepID=A0A3S0RUZ0_9BACI|nr:peptidoglycan endopeptidase [Lysinibacillus antri]RUL51279.1 peptidoglycan endopeptidase [Lysinibacillus antri]